MKQFSVGEFQITQLETRGFGKGNNSRFFEERSWNSRWAIAWYSCRFARLTLRKQVGCPGTSVKEQAPFDLTPSILATFPRLSNMFLHFRQVIDSRLQKYRSRRKNLWNWLAIRSIKELNKRKNCAGIDWVEAESNLPRCFSPNPSERPYFSGLIEA